MVLGLRIFFQHFFSRLVGKLANTRCIWVKNIFIRAFIAAYSVDLSEACETNYRAYKTFNAFFTRALKPGARFVTLCASSILSPVDGKISAYGTLEKAKLLQVKGFDYSLQDLLSSPEEALLFSKGSFLTAYLAPSDYHRVHMPFAGRLRKITYIPGCLYSVNPLTVSKIENVFSQNERVVCYFDTEYGPTAIILVGAMVVASIVLPCIEWPLALGKRVLRHWEDFDVNHFFAQGAELGYFALGSTVVMLLPEGSIAFEKQVTDDKKIKAGENIAKWK